MKENSLLQNQSETYLNEPTDLNAWLIDNVSLMEKLSVLESSGWGEADYSD